MDRMSQVKAAAKKLFGMLSLQKGGNADVDIGMLAKTESILTPKDVYNVSVDKRIMGFQAAMGDVPINPIDHVGLAYAGVGGAKSKPKPKPKAQPKPASKPKPKPKPKAKAQPMPKPQPAKVKPTKAKPQGRSA